METVSIITGNQIDSHKIAEAIQLDRMSYGDAYQLQLNTCLGYHEKNNDIYIMAVDNTCGHIVGYINFTPIEKSLFLRLTSGNVIDTIITKDDIVPYQNKGMYWGYFSSIVVHPESRGHGIATQMLCRWSELILGLAVEREIFFQEIVADAVSDVGAHLLSEIGFSFVRSSSHDSKIMTLDFFSGRVARSRFNDKILDVYENHKQESGG